MRNKILQSLMSNWKYFLFAVYPLWTLSPVFIRDGNYQLGESYFGSHKYTDVAGAIRNAWILKSMSLPWSQNTLTNFPDGENFWRLINFTQTTQLITTWILTRTFSPSHTIAILIAIGWIATSIIIYIAARKVGLSGVYSFIAAILWQAMPATQAKATTQTSFLLVGLVLMSIILIFNVLHLKSHRVALVVLVLIIGITDSYLFFMSILAITFSTIAYFYLTKQKLYFRLGILLLTFILTVSWTIFHFIVPLTTFGNKLDNARINIPSDSQVLTFQGSLWDFLLPDTKSGLFGLFGKEWDRPIGAEFAPDLNYYVGVSVLVFVGLYFAKSHRNKLKKILNAELPPKPSIAKKNSVKIAKDAVIFQKILVANFILFLALSLNTTISYRFIDIPSLGNILKFLMPGVRVYSRFSLISVTILVILFAIVLSNLLSRVRKSYLVPLGLSLFLVVSMDLNSFGRNDIAAETDILENFRKEIHNSPSRVILQLPEPGRAWLDQAFLFDQDKQIRTVNALYNSSFIEGISSSAKKSRQSFLAALTCLNVNYLLVSQNSAMAIDMSGVESYLSEPEFSFVTNAILPGGTPEYKLDLALYRFNTSVEIRDRNLCLKTLRNGDSL
jgi:hypothetical protein